MSFIKKKILFLDRDGTICYDGGAFGSEKVSYDEVLKKVAPLDGVVESLKLAKEKGYMLIVISNQAGIAKGRFDEWHTHYSNKLLNEKLGGIIDGFYYCPHHETGKNNNGTVANNAKTNLIFECDCRKPAIGMFIECEKDLKEGRLKDVDERMINEKVAYEENREKLYKKKVDACEIDKENSYMIGDKWIDVAAGEKYGVRTAFVMTGEGKVEYNEKKEKFIREHGDLPTKYKVYDDINKCIRSI